MPGAACSSGDAWFTEPCFTIPEREPWLEEHEKEEDMTLNRISSSLSPLSGFGSFGPGNLGDLYRDEVESIESACPLRRAAVIVPQRQEYQDKRRAKAPSMCSKMLSALRYAADSATSLRGRRRRVRAAPLATGIRARPSAAAPRTGKNPTSVHAWEAPGEQPLKALARTASLDSTQSPSSVRTNSRESSSSLGSAHTTQYWSSSSLAPPKQPRTG